MLALVAAKAPSTVEDCCERLFEVALIAANRVSTLEEEFEAFLLEAWFVVIAAFVVARAASRLDDDTERFTDEV